MQTFKEYSIPHEPVQSPSDILEHFDFESPRAGSQKFCDAFRKEYAGNKQQNKKETPMVFDASIVPPTTKCLDKLRFYSNKSVYHEYAQRDILAALKPFLDEDSVQEIFVKHLDNPDVSEQVQTALSETRVHISPGTVLHVLRNPQWWDFGMKVCRENKTAGFDGDVIHPDVIAFMDGVLSGVDKEKALDVAEVLSFWYERSEGTLPQDTVRKAEELLLQKIRSAVIHLQDPDVSRQILYNLLTSSNAGDRTGEIVLPSDMEGNHEATAFRRFSGADAELLEPIADFERLRAFFIIEAQYLQQHPPEAPSRVSDESNAEVVQRALEKKQAEEILRRLAQEQQLRNMHMKERQKALAQQARAKFPQLKELWTSQERMRDV